ncbi:class IV adenylate cyclase [Candidatus Saccharibacteria bacterium oral taxon 488]|nr:class IV adenylate cyclase [Candidatus Saccharibacteria bacterium oral taxon 488]
MSWRFHLAEQYEIERKRKFAGNLEVFIAQLSSQGFSLVDETTEIGSYYSRSDVDFMQTVECLRVRQRNDFAEITYKPPTNQRTRTEDGVIVKPETNLPVNPENAAVAKQLLTNLGMVKLVEVNKFRRIFKYDDEPGLTIAIDEISGAGVFVETEIISEDKELALRQIEDVEARIGVQEFEIITQPYRDICMDISLKGC